MRRVRTPPRLAPRDRHAHKASVGRVLVVGGSRDMAGAPALAALGALRAGAGLVRVAVPRSVQARAAAFRPEALSAGLPETAGGGLAAGAARALAPHLEVADAVVLGPGAGRAAPTVRLLGRLAREVTQPVVVDADALFALGRALGRAPAALAGRTAPTVLTPHEGEAARLLGVTSAEVRADREAAAVELARACGALVLLKGHGTVVTDAERIFVNPTGGPLLATGGTGDVLAGVVAAFLAGLPGSGGDAFGAAAAAAWVHGRAADDLARRADRGILATDVAEALPAAIGRLLSSRRRAGR